MRARAGETLESVGGTCRIKCVVVPVQWRDLAEPAGQRHHEDGRRRDGVELRHLVEHDVPTDPDGLQDRSRRAVGCGRGQELAGPAVRVRLRFRDSVLPLRRLRRCDSRPGNREPDLEGQPVRGRLGKRHLGPRNLADPELRRHSVGRSPESARSRKASPRLSGARLLGIEARPPPIPTLPRPFPRPTPNQQHARLKETR